MWQCKQCDEKLDDSFDSCWSCGYKKQVTKSYKDLLKKQKMK